jgi:glycosyltransferase involved in cell wall biosynthesis
MMSNSTNRTCLFVVSSTETPCGVEDFARKLTAALDARDKYDLFPVSGRWSELPLILRRIAQADRIVFSLPLVAWKRTIILPFVLLMWAWIGRRQIFLYLHEWSSLNPLRRLVFVPFLVLSETIILLSPFVRDQLASDRSVRWVVTKCRLAIIAPNIRQPVGRHVTEVALRVERLRTEKAIVIGQFGAIYKGKGTDVLLDACAHLRGLGTDASVVFVGGITKSLDGYENDFLAKVKALKLEDRVIVTGYVDDSEELFAIFERIDVFLYVFPEGLTSRRASVLTVLQSGRPVVVSEPINAEEFSHHEGYISLIGSDALVFFPREATTADLAGAIMSAATRPNRASVSVDYDTWWRNAARKSAAILDAHR